MSSRVPAVILARGGSKGLPRKNLAPLLGKPLISYSLEAALGAQSISSVYVSTDDHEIAELAEAYGAEIFWRSPEHAADLARSESSWIEIAQHLVLKGEIQINSPLCALQVTSPFRSPADIDNAVEIYFESGCDSLFSCVEFEDLTVWIRQQESAPPVPLEEEILFREPRQTLKKKYFIENGSIYMFTLAGLQEHGTRFYGKIATSKQDKLKMFEIDSYEDLVIANKIIKLEKSQERNL